VERPTATGCCQASSAQMKADCLVNSVFRVATHLENLEKSGNSKVVREKGKSQGNCLLDFERAEELKLQLLAACGPGLWIRSSLTLL